MLYAKFMYPDNGYNSDIKSAKEAGLKIGANYEVADIIMGQSHTSIYLQNINGSFNAVQFDFEEDGQPVDIYRTTKYNPYLYI